MKLQNSIKHYWGINSFSTALATTSSDELLVKVQTGSCPDLQQTSKNMKEFELQKMLDGR